MAHALRTTTQVDPQIGGSDTVVTLDLTETQQTGWIIVVGLAVILTAATALLVWQVGTDEPGVDPFQYAERRRMEQLAPAAAVSDGSFTVAEERRFGRLAPIVDQSFEQAEVERFARYAPNTDASSDHAEYQRMVALNVNSDPSHEEAEERRMRSLVP